MRPYRAGTKAYLGCKSYCGYVGEDLSYKGYKHQRSEACIVYAVFIAEYDKEQRCQVYYDRLCHISDVTGELC